MNISYIAKWLATTQPTGDFRVIEETRSTSSEVLRVRLRTPFRFADNERQYVYVHLVNARGTVRLSDDGVVALWLAHHDCLRPLLQLETRKRVFSEILEPLGLGWAYNAHERAALPDVEDPIQISVTRDVEDVWSMVPVFCGAMRRVADAIRGAKYGETEVNDIDLVPGSGFRSSPYGQVNPALALEQIALGSGAGGGSQAPV